MTKISNVRKTTKFKRSIKAISPVIATLLMIAIAVVASLVVYAWVTGYIGGTTSKTGKAINIPSIASVGGHLYVYVQNVGQGQVALKQQESLYVNDNLVPITLPVDPITINPGQIAELQTAFAFAPGDKANIKVTTTDGTFMTVTGTATSISNASPTPSTPPVQYAVNFVLGSGGLSMNPTAGSQNVGGSVPITATASTGNHFTSWSSTGSITFADANAASTTATVSGAGSITANFAADTVQYSVSFALGANGATITPTTGPHTYNSGDVVSISATANSGYHFSSWSSSTGSITFANANSAATTATIGAAGTVTANFAADIPVLDHFTFNTINSPQTAGTAFSITITAKDANGNTLTSYSQTNTLTVSSGTINPTSTTAFISGVWTGSVTLYTSGSGITIGTTGNSKTGTSNSITVNAGTGNFGYQTIGTSSYPMNPNNGNEMILGSIYTMGSQSGTANSITAYISTNNNNRNVKAAIYTASGTFVASADEKAVNNNGGWVTFTFSSGNRALTANTQYALVLWSSNAIDFYRLVNNNVDVRYTYVNYGNWPSPGGFTTGATNQYSIFCTYSIP